MSFRCGKKALVFHPVFPISLGPRKITVTGLNFAKTRRRAYFKHPRFTTKYYYDTLHAHVHFFVLKNEFTCPLSAALIRANNVRGGLNNKDHGFVVRK